MTGFVTRAPMSQQRLSEAKLKEQWSNVSVYDTAQESDLFCNVWGYWINVCILERLKRKKNWNKNKQRLELWKAWQHRGHWNPLCKLNHLPISVDVCEYSFCDLWY